MAGFAALWFNVLRIPNWSRRRQKQMQDIGTRAARMASDTGNQAQIEKTASAIVNAAPDEELVEDEAAPASSQSRGRTRS